MFKLRPIEFFLMQVIGYLGIWLYNDYMGSLLSIVFAGIFLAILIISLIVEWIEPSKVPRSYFLMMLVSVLAPIIAMGLYLLVMGGKVEWLMG